MKHLLPLAGFLVFVALTLSAWGIYQNHRTSSAFRAEQQSTNHRICTAIYNLDKQITDSVLRSKKSLEHGGIAYYQTHPKERALVIQQINQELATFKPRTCE